MVYKMMLIFLFLALTINLYQQPKKMTKLTTACHMRHFFITYRPEALDHEHSITRREYEYEHVEIFAIL